jgi:transposase-like protein
MKTDESVKNLNKVIKNDEARIKNHLGVMVRSTLEETLGYYHFPREHWCQIRTNNPLERIMRQIRRRSRVVGCFPDGNSALMLAAARLRHIAGTKWGTKRYMNKAKRIDLPQSMSPSDKAEKAAIEVVNLIF